VSRKSARGFTIVEVTLAIVIGIILIAGATLIYNQAKQAAGNSRALAKTSSMQSIVEQFLARSDGVPPDAHAIRAMWRKARSDDYDKSPWGGKCIPCSPADPQTSAQVMGNVPAPGTFETEGVLDGNTLTPDQTDLVNALISEPSSGGNEPPKKPLRGPTDGSYLGGTGGASGVMIYYRFLDARAYGIWDESRRDLVWGRAYACAITNSDGYRWYFIQMNRAGGSGDNPLGITGQLGN
jgi:type II secretory pathway pseudopilin PulG